MENIESGRSDVSEVSNSNGVNSNGKKRKYICKWYIVSNSNGVNSNKKNLGWILSIFGFKLKLSKL